MSCSRWPKIVLFGDSITQRSFEPGGWGAAIADQVQRKCDVICRGFSGYNTKWALAGMSNMLPTDMLKDGMMATIFFGANDACVQEIAPEKHVPVGDYSQNIKCDVVNRGFSGYNSRWARIVLAKVVPQELLRDAVALTLFFGANDACLQSVWPKQYEGVQDYADNMKAIISYFEKHGLRKEKILLITPPPIDEATWAEACKEKGTALNRTLKNSGLYAQACRDLGQDMNMKVVDLWTMMQKEENWGSRFLSDGLHLSADGAGFLYKQLSGFVDDCTASLPQQFPDWSEIDHTNPEKSFQES